jgi:hypothetical protein
VLRSWVEDFVDEDTGEVVSIERNEVVLERDSVLDEEALTPSPRWISNPSLCRKKTWVEIMLLSTIP